MEFSELPWLQIYRVCAELGHTNIIALIMGLVSLIIIIGTQPRAWGERRYSSK